MKMHIRTRIFLPVLLVLLLLPLAVWLVFGVVSERFMERLSQQEIDLLYEKVRPIAEGVFTKTNPMPNTELEHSQSKTFIAKVKKMLRQTQNDAQLMILTPKQGVIYPKNLDTQKDARVLFNFLTYEKDSKELKTHDYQRISLDGRDYLIRIWQLAQGENMRAKYMIAYNPLYGTAELLSSIGSLVLVITAAVTGLSLIAAWGIADSIAKSMKHLCTYASEIGEGNFNTLEEKNKICEIDELSHAMLTMSKQLKRTEEIQKTFLQNASHELRTPLMSISGYAQGIQYGVFEDSTEPVDAILSESKRLTELVDELLSLSRMDCVKESLELRTLNLAELISVCLEQLGGFALEHNVRLTFPTHDSSILMNIDEKLFARSFSNIVSNAIRFAKSDVTIDISREAENTIVTIADDGDGIKSDDLPHLFERFYKGKGGNSGLGLAIAKTSIEYMGGEISAKNNAIGAIFEIIL